MKSTTKKAVTVWGIIIFLCLSWIFLIHIAIRAADPTTEDPEDYLSILQAMQYPGNFALSFFPNDIPESAQNVFFCYQPPIGQGGELLCLKYQIDIDTIQSYQQMAAQRSIWSGSLANKDAKLTEVYVDSLTVFDYAENGIPSDLTIYLIYQKQSAQKDWNHGEIGLIAISVDTCEVLFMFNHW